MSLTHTDWTPEQEAEIRNRLEGVGVKKLLMAASLYLFVYEILKAQFVDRIVSFYANHYGPEGPEKSEEYIRTVSALDNKEFVAAAKWYQIQGILTADQVNLLRSCKQMRDAIAHEPWSLFLDPSLRLDHQHFKDLMGVLAKVDEFWKRVDFESTPPELQRAETADEAFSFSTLLIYLITEQAFSGSGNEVALSMKPACGRCGAITPAVAEAYICTHECTFCARCAGEFSHVCPNCSGELVRRPRPAISTPEKRV